MSAPVFFSNFHQKKNLLIRLPITLMRNRGQEKESMGGASGFAEVELKLSTNVARCEGLSYILSRINIYLNHENAIGSHIDCFFPHNKGQGT